MAGKGYYSAAIYFGDRHYGGPEEGGWWYNAGEPVSEFAHLYRRFRTVEGALRYADKLKAKVEKLNEGRAPISSMASRGAYMVRVVEGDPVPFPEHQPHYE